MSIPAGTWPSTDANGIDLVDPICLSEGGTVLLLARKASSVVDMIYYNVMLPSTGDTSDAGLWQGWNYLPLTEPNQSDVPSAQASADEQPLLRVGGIGLITVPPLVKPLSPADAQFRAVSDGKYISVFRLSTDNSLYVDRFVLVQGEPENATRSPTTAMGASWTLQRAWEVRYRRSELRDMPDGSSDTLDCRNMLGEPFLEPTMEIASIPGLGTGGFDVALAPTADPQVRRWHFFTATASQLQGVSFLQDSTGRVLVSSASTPTSIAPLALVSDGSTPALLLTGGVSASVYSEQEAVGGSDSPRIGRAVRLMLAAPVSCASVNVAAAFAVYDFLVQTDGTIPAWPSATAVVPVDGTLSPTGFTATAGATSYPIPAAAVHVVGTATATGVLLGQPQPAGGPTLYASSAGMLHLYFAGRSNVPGTEPFLVAQFDPTATRTVTQLPWTAGTQTGQVSFVSQRTGSSTNAMAMAVTDCANQPDLCTVSINYGPAAGLPAETWTGVPRSLSAFLAVLNGDAAASAADPRALAGSIPFFDYSGALLQARLPLGSSLAPTGYLGLAGSRPDLQLASVSASAPVNSVTTLTFQFTYSGGTVTQTWAGLPVDGRQCAAVLAGDVSPAVYAYAPAATDTQLFALATDGGTILLANPPSANAVQIVVGAATDLIAGHCNIAITIGAGMPVRLTNLSRDQAAVVSALVGTNLFAWVSPDPLGAALVNQTIAAPTDLRAGASLFNVLPPVGHGAVVQASATAARLQGHLLLPVPASGTPNMLYAASVSAATRPQLGAEASVPNGTTQLSQSGTFGTWCVAATPQAWTSGSAAVSVPLTGPNAQRLVPHRRWTIETWCNPQSGAASRIVSYNNGPATRLAGVMPSYFVGTVGLDSLAFQSYAGGSYSASYVNVPANPQFDLASSAVTAFTWEAWVNPAATPCASGTLGCIVQGQTSTYPDVPLFQLAVDANLALNFVYRGQANNAPVLQTLKSLAPLPGGAWTHVAVTGECLPGGWTFRLYINARPDALVAAASFFLDVGAPFVCIGANDMTNVSVFGNLSEVRFWTSARTAVELDRTMVTSLTGYEPGLYGYWPLVEAPAQGAVFVNRAAITGTTLNGAMQVNKQPVSTSSDGTFVSTVAGVGGAPAVVAGSFMRSTHWNHIAVVYEASGALNLNPNGLRNGRIDFGRCDSPSSLSVATQNSFEAWVQVASSTLRDQTILAQWGNTPTSQCFQFGIAGNGAPFLAINVMPTGAAAQIVRVQGTASVCDGQPHHLAATWAVTSASGGNNSMGTATCTTTLYVDGAQVFQTSTTFQTFSVQIVSSTAPLTLGISALQTPAVPVVALETQAIFQGVLTGVRFWTVTLTAAQVAQAMALERAGDQGSGVVSAWWFDEDGGLDAEDSKGDNDFVLSDTDMWCAFAHLASLDIYANGVSVGRQAPYTAADYMAGARGFTLGAYDNSGTLQSNFAGTLAEVRLWSTARSQAQIREAMYHPLIGSEDALHAYWRLDGNLLDGTTGQNTGVGIGSIAFVPSTAPVANEGPQVRNVYGGPVTDFQEPIFGRASVLDYGSTERNADGAPVGTLRRCYFYNSPRLTLSTQYSVGELDLVYLGMAQTNPTLIGYIEGAPPVPSENLTRPLYNSYLGYNGYADATSVAITQSEATSVSFTSSDYQTSISMDMDWKLGLFGSWKVDVNGPFFSTETFNSKLKIGVHQKDNLVRARQTDTRYLSSWTRTVTNTLGLRGTWEAPGTVPADYLNPQVGRRYQPSNTGLALVESMSADVYAMCLKGNGASVGKVVIPNLAIPPDRNLLVFQINPDYTKNGTLDGKVGLVNDPSFPKADFERGSYFRPLEAYRLKASIERAEQDFLSYYQQFDAAGRGEGQNKDLSDVAQRQFVDPSSGQPRKAIVNNYVWDAFGGLYKDEEQYASTYEKVYNGFYSFNWSVGPYVDAEIAIVKIGVFGGLDLLFGGQTKVQVGKGETHTRQLGLSVNAPGEPFLSTYQGDSNYTQTPTPGKVTSYRFMSFYLPPSSDNASTFLDTVVDPLWRSTSDDPNAIALRSARVRGSSVWRVMHRVTYVERMPPQLDGSPMQTAAPDEQWSIMLDDNLLLIQWVQAALGASLPTPPNIGSAVATVLAPPGGGHSVLGQAFPWWQAFVTRAQAPGADPAAVALLTTILRNTCAYILAGYETKVLPLPAPTTPRAAHVRLTERPSGEKDAADRVAEVLGS